MKGSRNRMGVRLRGSPVCPGVPGEQTVGPVADRRRTGPAQRRAERNKSYFKWAVVQGAFRWSVERTIGSSNCVMARQGWNGSLRAKSAVIEARGRPALGAARRARVVSEEAARRARGPSEEAARHPARAGEEVACRGGPELRPPGLAYPVAARSRRGSPGPSKRRKRRATQISRRGVPGIVDKRFEMEEKAGPFSVTAVR